MSTLQHALREHEALKDQLGQLMERMDVNERLIKSLSGGGNSKGGGKGGPAPVKSRSIDSTPQNANRGGGGRPHAAQTYGAPSPPTPGPSSLQASYVNRPPTAGHGRPAKKLTTADLQACREEFNAACNAEPSVDHWAEPGDKPSSATLDQTERTLKECFEKTREFQRNLDNPVQALQMLFNRLDPNHSGKLDRQEFTSMGNALGFGADQKVMNSLFNRYDVDRSNTLDTAEFGRILFKTDSQSKALSTIGRVRECLSIRAGGFATLRCMAIQFRIGDRDRSGQLAKEEFDIMLDILLNAFKLRLSPAEKNNLFAYFDADKSGGVSYDEFVKEVRGPMDEAREHFVQDAFKILDKDGSGVVDERDIAGNYDASQNPSVRSGKVSAQECMNKFLDSFGGSDGKITYEQFLEHYQWISSNIDSDDYFELMMRNAWHMSGGQGWSANTSDLRVLVRHSNGSEEVVELQHDMGLPKDADARYQEIVRRLQQQGVKDIRKVEMCAGMTG